MATLTPEQVEIAAQTSYAYWLATLSDKPPTTAEREKMALREIRRTLFKNTYEKALSLIQGTVIERVVSFLGLEARDWWLRQEQLWSPSVWVQTTNLHSAQERRLDIVRSCFFENVEYDTEEDKALAEEFRGMIEVDMTSQICVVRGHDTGNLAILTVFARTAEGASDVAFVCLMLYAMERATAATEFLSMGANEKIMVVLDFGSFDASVAPSWKAIKSVAKLLQHHYPERLRRLVILDPPFWIRALYKMVSPFLDPETKKKFVVCSGQDEKIAIMKEFITSDQAMPFMRPDGGLTSEIDVQHYTRKVPFHMTYDATVSDSGIESAING